MIVITPWFWNMMQILQAESTQHYLTRRYNKDFICGF